MAFVVAPASTLISGESYSVISAGRYVATNWFLFINQWGIDDTLVSVPHPSVWNGSLWTLIYEVGAYLCAGVLLSFGWARRNGLLLSTALLVVAVAAGPYVGSMGFGPVNAGSALQLGSYFAAGMVFYFLRDRVPISGLLALVSIVALAAIMLVGSPRFSVPQLPLAYLILYAGTAPAIRIGRTNDLSYGMYIFAFPVQQMLVLSGARSLGWAGFAVTSTLLTLPLAWLSWRFVEKPAMLLRSPRPTRWARSRSDHAVEHVGGQAE